MYEYFGATAFDIERYTPKKKDEYISYQDVMILPTPESFGKIKEAFEMMDIHIYSTCFLLFDECHKIVKDVDYRSDITLPIDDFFLFRQLQFLSAIRDLMNRNSKSLKLNLLLNINFLLR